MKLLNKITNIDFYSLPAIENGILMNGFARGGMGIITALKNLNINPIWMGNESDISISFTHPFWYDSSTRKLKIGYTPWESTKFPNQGWTELMNSMDVIWATTPWVKEVYKANGVTVPIYVAQEGLDAENVSLSKRTLGGPFTFLHVGEPAKRKGGQLVLDAFKKVFGRNKDVHLVIKALKGTELKTSAKNITIDTNLLTIPEVDNLYHSSHCLVYPSSGEGFGRIPIEAIGSGLPTILTPYSGMEVFSEYGIELKYTVGPTGDDFNRGEWAFPDFEDICEKMRYVYENYDKVAEAAFSNAKIVREKFPYDQGIIDALDRTVEEHF